MTSERNRGRAEQLLRSMPTGEITPSVFLPWAAKAICFLLNRYILGD